MFDRLCLLAVESETEWKMWIRNRTAQKNPESHSVPYRQAQTVLRTVPLHVNRTPSRSVKLPSRQI